MMRLWNCSRTSIEMLAKSKWKHASSRYTRQRNNSHVCHVCFVIIPQLSVKVLQHLTCASFAANCSHSNYLARIELNNRTLVYKLFKEIKEFENVTYVFDRNRVCFTRIIEALLKPCYITDR